MILSPPRTLLDHIPFEAVSCRTADRLTFGISIAVAVGRASDDKGYKGAMPPPPRGIEPPPRRCCYQAGRASDDKGYGGAMPPPPRDIEPPPRRCCYRAGRASDDIALCGVLWGMSGGGGDADGSDKERYGDGEVDAAE